MMLLSFHIWQLMLIFALVIKAYSAPTITDDDHGSPSVTVTNGTLIGKYVSEWQQDQFLGIPYAQPPVDSLRFARPRSFNSTFQSRNATEYGASCYQYEGNFILSEDCLFLNVVRPSGIKKPDKHPVLVWVYGGGLFAESTTDPRYNVSGVVELSQRLGKPIIVVSINYRVGVWGFFQSPQSQAEGNANAGLLDQRMAFRWIQENIEAFGGDPTQVTIWGESAGAQSIAYHLHSYGGRNDGLFSAAILESGSAVGAQVQPLAYYTVPVENLTRTLDCWTATDQLGCLRHNVSSAQLFEARGEQLWNPVLDGDFLEDYPSALQREGKFVRVPLLLGSNTDEGSLFGTDLATIAGVNTTEQLYNNLLTYRSFAITPWTARRLLQLYPNDPAHEPPYAITTPAVFPSKGLQWRRAAAIAGDMVMIAGVRKLAMEYATAGQAVYSYRFDTPLWNAAITDGVNHFVNVGFSFQNITGSLGPLPKYQSYRDLSTNIGRSYIGFVHKADPNWITAEAGQSRLPYWPRYAIDKPQNMVLNSNTTYIEKDVFRKEGIDFLNSGRVARELLA